MCETERKRLRTRERERERHTVCRGKTTHDIYGIKPLKKKEKEKFCSLE